MSLSPQQLKDLLETSKRLKAKPAPLGPGAEGLTFAPKPFPSTLSPRAVASPPLQLLNTQAEAQSPQRTEPSAALQVPSPVSTLRPVPVNIPPGPTLIPEADPGLEDFSSFSGLAKKQPSLPRGAKNVKCHTVERDPDTGKIARVYTYDVAEEESQSGDQISRQPEEQRTGPD